MAARSHFAAFPWREGVVPVEVDGELLVLDADAGRVVRLSGVAKAAVEQHRSVRPTGLSRDTPGVIDALAGLGLVQEQMSAVDRRAVLRAGALAALGVSVVALPSAAAAATGGGDGGDGLFASGSGDETFLAAGAPNSTVYVIQSQPDGKIFIGGEFTQIGGVTYGRLARLNADGTLDNTFTNPAFTSGLVADLDVDSDGSVVAVGTMQRAFAPKPIARFDADGTLDANFAVSNLYNSIQSVAVEAVRIRDDGGIYIGGQFTHIEETSRYGLGLLKSNGALDTNFADAGLNAYVFSLGLDGNSVVAGGLFTTTASGTYTRLARFLPNGAVDTTMNVDPNVNGQIRKVSVDGAGGIHIAGTFTQVGGETRSKVARVLANGQVDPNFAPPTISGSIGDVRAILVQGDGRVIIGGRFTAPASYIARLEPNGASETDFNLGADSGVWALALDSSGRLLVGGTFTNIGGISRSYLARID